MVQPCLIHLHLISLIAVTLLLLRAPLRSQNERTQQQFFKKDRCPFGWAHITGRGYFHITDPETLTAKPPPPLPVQGAAAGSPRSGEGGGAQVMEGTVGDRQESAAAAAAPKPKREAVPPAKKEKYPEKYPEYFRRFIQHFVTTVGVGGVAGGHILPRSSPLAITPNC